MKYGSFYNRSIFGALLAWSAFLPPSYGYAAIRNLDVNDVSILFSLPKQGENGMLLTLADKAGHGPFLEAADFQRLLDTVKPTDDQQFGQDGERKPENWKIIAVRFDDCAKVASQSDCFFQLRLVAQPSRLVAQSLSIRDHAIHLVHQYSEAEGKQMIQEFVDLSLRNSGAAVLGKPLGVHPVMLAQGLKGTFASGVKRLLKKYCGQKRLEAVAVMLTIGGSQWRFATALMQGGVFKQTPIPHGTDETITHLGTTGFTGTFINQVIPEATGPDNVNEIVNSHDGPGGNTFFLLTGDEQEKRVQSALRIENPTLHSVTTTDCVSCHAATHALIRVKGRKFVDLMDNNPNRFFIPPGITGKFAPEANVGGAYETRAFGYLGTKALFVQRTVNESVAVAHHINTTLIKEMRGE